MNHIEKLFMIYGIMGYAGSLQFRKGDFKDLEGYRDCLKRIDNILTKINSSDELIAFIDGLGASTPKITNAVFDVLSKKFGKDSELFKDVK